MRLAATLVVGVAVVSTASVAPVADVTVKRPVPPQVETLPLTHGERTTGERPQETTSELRRTDDFSLLGVTWKPGAQGRYEIVVRTRTDGRWTVWVPLEVSADGDEAGRPGTAPHWAGTSDGVQVRVLARNGHLPDDLAVDLIDPGRSAADGMEPAETQHAAPKPRIRTRNEWGADESLRTSEPKYTSTIKAGFVHHTAGANKYTEAQVPQIIRGVYAYHVKSRGWSDIGYQFLVDRFGRLWEGRYGGVEKPVLGAHAGGFNTNTFGVSALGTFTETPAPRAMQEAIADLMAWKLARYHHDAHEKTVLVSEGGGTSRYPAGTQVTADRISGHRDVGRTDCPGELLYDTLPRIRDLAAARIDEDAP